jgi:hypothetical protein
VRAPSIECVGYCQGECEADCQGYCAEQRDRTTCMGECTESCRGSCQGYCKADPGAVDCQGQCRAACSAHCEASANLDCNIQCSAQARASCEAQLEGSCTADCNSKGGILVCNGEVTTFGSWEDVVAYAEAHGITVDAQGSCTGNTCSGSVSVASKGGLCSVTSFADATSSKERLGWLGLVSLLGLLAFGVRRRARR